MTDWKNQLAREVCVELGYDPNVNYQTDDTEIAIMLRTIFDTVVHTALSEGKYDPLQVSTPLTLKDAADKTKGYYIPADYLRPVGVVSGCDCETGCCFQGVSYITNVRFTILNNALYINSYSCGNVFENSYSCVCCCSGITDLIYTSFRIENVPINIYNAIKKGLINALIYQTTKDLNTKQVATNEYREEIRKANIHQGEDYRQHTTDCFIPFIGSKSGRLV